MNKYQDAINNIKNNNDYEPSYYGGWDYYDVLQELIDKEDKYKWHDLRKNPNDLPKQDGKILICFKRWSNIIDEWVDCDYTTNWFIDGEFEKFGWYGDKKPIILGWKYIDGFENE